VTGLALPLFSFHASHHFLMPSRPPWHESLPMTPVHPLHQVLACVCVCWQPSTAPVPTTVLALGTEYNLPSSDPVLRCLTPKNVAKATAQLPGLAILLTLLPHLCSHMPTIVFSCCSSSYYACQTCASPSCLCFGQLLPLVLCVLQQLLQCCSHRCILLACCNKGCMTSRGHCTHAIQCVCQPNEWVHIV
jgi:hypothetical protein